MGGNDRLGNMARGTIADARTQTQITTTERGRAQQQLYRGDDVIQDAVGERLSARPDLFERDSRLLDMHSYGEFRQEGLAWILSCDDAQTHRLVTTAGSVGSAIAAPAIPVMGAIAAAGVYIEAINSIGGSNGVEITGVVGMPGVIVTPRWGKLLTDLQTLGTAGLSGRALTSFLVNAAANNSALATALQLPAVATVAQQIMAGTPLGWALAGALGFAVRLFEEPPDINDHGAVMADREHALAWESFTIAQLGDGTKVALLSWLGHLSAQMGGGHGVYANRPEVGPWETWTMVDNRDGTISLRTENDHYLCAEMGGGRECQANRRSIGDWEKFILVPLANGKFALRTYVGGRFVSVQS